MTINELLENFMESELMDELVAHRLKDDYQNVLDYINAICNRAANGIKLNSAAMNDFDSLMDDLIGLQQVLRMYVYEPDLPVPAIPHTLMEDWVQWKKKQSYDNWHEGSPV